MIHGEALAIRALMHFEILRLYAPSVAEDDGKLYIPYFDKFPSVVEPYQTVSTILGRVEDDLLNAKALLKEVDLSDDAILLMTLNYRRNGGSGMSGSNNYIDPFINFRLFRMNYAATTAILARVYSYAGKAKEAYDQATEVIEMTDADGNLLFDFTDFTEFGTKPKMSDDLIFSLSNTKATEYWTTFYENEDKLGLYYDDYDEILMENANDRRWMPDGGAIYADYDTEYMAFSKKFMDEASIDPIEKRILPVIRLGELYYIRGEYLAQTNPEAAVQELETVSTARGCTPGNFSWVASEEDYRNAVLQDARKELIGEGQLYYFYKKYNIKPDSDTDFVFPKPLNETIF